MRRGMKSRRYGRGRRRGASRRKRTYTVARGGIRL